MIKPFDGLSTLQKNKLLKKLESHIYKFNDKDEFSHLFESTKSICILLEGKVIISNLNYLGEETIIEEISKDEVFSNVFTNINRNVEIRSSSFSRVLIIDYNKLIKIDNTMYSFYNIFLLNLFQIITNKLKENNTRLEIITEKTTRDKLLSFFENEYRKTHSSKIYLQYSLKNLASYLSVNRSSMFRELKSLKDDNFIKIEGNKITLLYTPEL